MNANQRVTLLVVSMIMLGLGFWASTFASAFIEANYQLTVGLYTFGLVMITGHAMISAVSLGKIEKRLALLEGDPETPPKPEK